MYILKYVCVYGQACFRTWRILRYKDLFLLNLIFLVSLKILLKSYRGVSLTPVLMAYDFQPLVISATAMFLIMISKLAAAILYSISQTLLIYFCLFLGMFLVLSS